MPPLRTVLTLLPQLDAHLGDQNEGKMRIFVAGHGGMVGQALLRALEARGHDEVITPPVRRLICAIWRRSGGS